MITAAQCRAARAWFDPPITQAELAKMVDRDISVVRRFEDDAYGQAPFSEMLRHAIGEALQHALEERGILFVNTPKIGRIGIEGPA
jgi:hypothetical protein